MIVVGGALMALVGLIGLLLLLGITNDLDVIYGLGIFGASMIIVSGIFIAVSYAAKTYTQGFQEALGATNKRLAKELATMKEMVDKLEEKKENI